MSTAGRCGFVRPDGSQCGGAALRNSDPSLCFFHSPSAQEKRAAARQAGGRKRIRAAAVLPHDTPDVPLRTITDVAALLGATINQVRRGELDPKVANCIGLLAGQLAKCIQGGDLEQRLAKIEQHLSESLERGKP
jgi:hypothetical protein